MVHPNELDRQIENLRTLQGSYDQIATAAEAYNVGKIELAQNITAKGVQASASETLPELAEKVGAISQESYTIDGGEMYAKQLFGSLETPNYWNLYEVLAQLLSDGRLVNYGGILLASYGRGYNSLALAGAGAGGAYVVSDKDTNGQFIMYTEDTTHTWDTTFDGKGNRWVAYCFDGDWHDFQITDTNTSPRSIFIGRKVGVITSLVVGRCSQLVVPDNNKLANFTGEYTQNWGETIVIKNLANVTSGSVLICSPVNTENVYVSADKFEGGFVIKGISNTTYKISSIIIKSPIINTTLISRLSSFSSLSTIVIKGMETGVLNIVENPGDNAYNLKDVVLNISGGTVAFTQRSNVPSGLRLSISQLGTDKTKTISLSYLTFNGWTGVISCMLNSGFCAKLNVSPCTGLDETAIYTGILQRLKQDEADCGDGVTITLGATNLAKLTSEESVQLLDDLTNIYGYTFA